MKDIYDIARFVRSGASDIFALATLVKARGSSYRRPGARMLISRDGQAIGSLSGGCLEDEVVAEANDVLRTGIPKLVCFDTRKRFGCNGEIMILVERIESRLFLEIAAELNRRKTCVIQTVFETRLAEEAISFAVPTLGTHLLLNPADGRQADRSQYILSPDGALTQVVQPPLRIFIIGDGPDSAPICEMSRALGWIPFPIASIHEADFSADDQTAALIKTHNYGKDFEALRHLLPLNLRYIGLIGPRRRRDQLLHDLLEIGIAIHAGFFAPAGLDIRSETPAEIALAVVSEIQRVFAGGTGASLRERKIPIHEAAKLQSEQAAVIP